MNKIRIIDLLNKIANGEEVPSIKWYDRTLIWNSKHEWFDDVEDRSYCKSNFEMEGLNDEVEILDEEDEFEDIEELDISDRRKREDCYPLTVEIMAKINELIKNQKKIINKIKEEK